MAAGGVKGWAQSDPPDDIQGRHFLTKPALRKTLDDLAGDKAGLKGSVPAPSRVGRIPSYQVAPSRGAGRTGFVSTNKPIPVGVLKRLTIPARMQGVVDPTQSTDGLRGPEDALGETRGPGDSTPATSAVEPASPATGKGTAAAGTAPGASTSTKALNSVTPLPVRGPPGPYPTLVLRKKRPPEDDPFDAVGIRAGTFILRPAIEVWSGYDTNPARSIGGKGSPLITVSPELQARSDWDRHEFTANIHGSYSEYPSVPFGNRPALDAKVDGRIDVTRDTRIDLEARDVLGTDYPGSPNVPADVKQLPIFDTFGGTAGVGERFDRLDVAVKGAVDRTVWAPSELTNGASDSNNDRNYNQYAGLLRAGYEFSPAFTPFVAVGADSRVHDLRLDRTGTDRDSDGFEAHLGTAVDLARVLTGVVSIGYLERLYAAPKLADLKALAFDGSLIWNATALTTVRLVSRTTADESVLPGVSGVIDRAVELDVDHALRRWLIATARLGYGRDAYVGTNYIDQRYLAGMDLTYKLTRTTQIKGELRQEWLHSNMPGLGYSATVAMIGLRYQP
jgi:hypothetical protein